MKGLKRGDIWSADLEPQTHKAEPGKRDRPVLILQTNGLNDAGHPTVIVIPGTSNGDSFAPGDNFPLRVRIQKAAALAYDTDLLIDQIRSISTKRLGSKLHALTSNSLKQVEEAVRILMLRP